MLEQGPKTPAARNFDALVEDYERQLIGDALAAANGSQRAAAALLGVLPTTLNEKMKRLGIARPLADRGLRPAGGPDPRGRDGR